MLYNFTVTSDMGHLLVNPRNVPSKILDFVMMKVKMCVDCATDKNHKYNIYLKSL